MVYSKYEGMLCKNVDIDMITKNVDIDQITYTQVFVVQKFDIDMIT